MNGKQWLKTSLCVLLCSQLAACGGGGGSGGDGGIGSGRDASGLCRGIGGGSSTVSTSPAVNASFTDAAKIFDGDVGSFGALNTIGGTGNSSMQGTTQSGVVVPQGAIAGVLIKGTLTSNINVTVTTYLAGVPQDTGPAVTTISSDEFEFLGIRTNQQFDSIKVAFNLTNDSSSLPIYELCIR